MLSIGELAAYVGVTPRAVRFYHQRGLMPEPERDAAGYRRYGARDVIRLSRIAALTGAGVPLARIGTMLDADDARFAADLDRIDADVAAEVARLEEVRRRLRELGSADRLALPAELGDMVATLRDSGLPDAQVDLFRDGWILNLALYGAGMQRWLDNGAREMLRDPEHLELHVATLRIAHHDPDHPDVEDLAQRSAAWTAANWEVQSRAFDDIGWDDDAANVLVDGHWLSTPAWERLSRRTVELLRERGLDRPEFAVLDEV